MKTSELIGWGVGWLLAPATTSGMGGSSVPSFALSESGTILAIGARSRCPAGDTDRTPGLLAPPKEVCCRRAPRRSSIVQSDGDTKMRALPRLKSPMMGFLLLGTPPSETRLHRMVRRAFSQRTAEAV